MANKKIMGIDFEIDVASALTGIQNFRRNVKAAQADFRATSSTMEDWQNTTEGLEAKLKELTIVENEQRKILLRLKESYEKAKSDYEQNSEALEKLKASGTATKKEINELTKIVNINRQSVVNAQTAYDNQVAVTNKTIESVKQFENALKRVNDDKLYNIDELSSEVELASARYEEAAAKSENLSKDLQVQKLKVDELNKVYELHSAELASLNQQLAEQGEENDDNRSTINRLKSAIIAKRVEVTKDEAALKKQIDATQDLDRELLVQNSTFGKLKRTLKEVSESFGDAAEGTRILEGGFTVLKGVVTHFISNTLHSLFGTLRYLLSDARNLRKELGMIEATGVAIGFNQKELSSAEQTLKKIYKITEDTGTGTEAINNLLTAGFKTDSLDEVTDYLLGASIKWKDTLNIESLSDSIQEAIGSKGMSVAGQFAELLERTGHNLEDWKLEFSSLGTEAERQDMIMKALAKGGLKETLTQYEEINETLMDENEILYETLHQSAKFAEFVNPMILKIKELGNEIMLSLMKFFGYEEALGEFNEEGQKTIKSIMKQLDVLKDRLVILFEFLLNNIEEVTAALAGIGAVLVAKKGTSLALGVLEQYNAAIVALGKSAVSTADKLGAMGKAVGINKVSIIIAVIAAVLAGLIALYKNNEEFKKSIDDLWATLKPALMELIPPINNLVTKLIPVIVELANALVPVLILIVDVIKQLLPVIIEIVKDLVPFIVESTELLLPIIMMILELIKEILPPLITLIRNILPIIITIIKQIVTDLGGLVDIIANVVLPILQALIPIIQVIIELIKYAINSTKANLETFVKFFKTIFEMILAYLDGDTEKAKEIWHNFTEEIKNLWGNLFSGLIEGLKEGWSNLKKSFGKLIDELISWFKEKLGIHSPSKLFAGFGRNIVDGLVNGIRSFYGKIKESISTIVNFFTDLPSKIWNKIKGVADKIKEAFTSAVAEVKTVGGDIVDGLWNGIKSKTEWVKGKITDFCESVGKTIKDWFGVSSPSKWAIEQGGFIGEGVGIGVLNSADGVSKNIKKFNESVAEGISGGTSNLTGGNSTVVNAGMTVNYNGNLSRKQLKQLENDNYNSIKMRLKLEGAI